MATKEALRTVDDQAAPAPGTWTIDSSHSVISFSVRHLGISKVRGQFEEFSGTIQVGERPENSSVDVTIQAASINTGDSQRDGHVRSEDFLEVETYPTLQFSGQTVRMHGGGKFELDGELTIIGTTRPVTLSGEFNGAAADPGADNQNKAAFEASTSINREDFGLTWNVPLDAGGVMVGKDVNVELEVQALQQ